MTTYQLISIVRLISTKLSLNLSFIRLFFSWIPCGVFWQQWMTYHTITREMVTMDILLFLIGSTDWCLAFWLVSGLSWDRNVVRRRLKFVLLTWQASPLHRHPVADDVVRGVDWTHHGFDVVLQSQYRHDLRVGDFSRVHQDHQLVSIPVWRLRKQTQLHTSVRDVNSSNFVKKTGVWIFRYTFVSH